jgi:hypothetical protein
MRFTLYIDGKKVGPGSLSVCENGSAQMWRDEHRVMAVMDRVRIVSCEAGGLRIDGYEPHGNGRFRHVEWLLTPVEEA